MALCSACHTITVFSLVCELEDVPDWWHKLNSKSKPRGMMHHHDARQLRVSAAAGCPLCAMIRDATILQYDSNRASNPHDTHQTIGAGYQHGTLLEGELMNSPIYLRPNLDPLKLAFPDRNVATAPHVRGFKVFVPVNHGVLTGQIRLFAPRDSPAAISCDVVGRPALPSSDSPEAFDLIGRWMSACLNQHEACRKTFAGAAIEELIPPALPTRVIHLGSPDGAVCPRLFETKGMTGYYCAVSHCWGSRKPPLMTTKASLKQHIAGIPWDDVPKAHQDAMIAAHRLGFRFMWLDTLCIIQNSREDWLYESKQMGSVYENARLTIAASHASDSSQPCFFIRPQPPVPVELPYISRSGEHAGSIFATPMPRDYRPVSPEFGPLADRAWATQEWLLARRMIFYTAECLVWSCKVLSQRETGGSFHSTARNPRWKNIVEKYSARGLTQASDRLIALEGLRTEMGTKRVNDTYCFGLWKNGMPDQLLWFCLQPAERAKSPLSLPSWSWASTMHGVRFVDIRKTRNTCGGFHFNEANKTLVIRGQLREAAIAVCDDIRSRFDGLPQPMSSLLADAVQDGVRSDMMCAISYHGVLCGWGTLDEGFMTDDVTIVCLQLMARKVSVPDSCGAKQRYYHSWILLLRKVERYTELFERVGIGLTVGDKPQFDNEISTQIYIR